MSNWTNVSEDSMKKRFSSYFPVNYFFQIFSCPNSPKKSSWHKGPIFVIWKSDVWHEAQMWPGSPKMRGMTVRNVGDVCVIHDESETHSMNSKWTLVDRQPIDGPAITDIHTHSFIIGSFIQENNPLLTIDYSCDSLWINFSDLSD